MDLYRVLAEGGSLPVNSSYQELSSGPSSARRMKSRVGKSVMLILGGLLVIWSPVFGGTPAPGMIADLKLSPDFKRLVIRSDGMVNEPTVSKATRPSRLVIDFQTADLGKFPRLMEFKDKPIKEIRTASLKAGARIVVDFGDHAVPDYRVRHIGDCFMVFLGDYKPPPAARRGPRRAAKLSMEAPESSPSLWAPVPATTGKENLIVRSAKVRDGRIVVDAAERTNPRTTYRISLRLDTHRPRFSDVEIRVIHPSNGQREAQQKARPTRLSVKPSRGPVRDARSTAIDRGGLSVQRGPTRPGEALAHLIGSRQGLFTESAILTVAGCAFNPEDSD